MMHERWLLMALACSAWSGLGLLVNQDPERVEIGDAAGSTHRMIVRNSCSEQTVWAGVLGTVPIPANGGFMLKPNTERQLQVDNGWSGRIWGRTNCQPDGTECATGGCGNGTECAGTGGNPPATLAEITFGATPQHDDFYDLSLVDGYNLPMKIEPFGRKFGLDGKSSYICGSAGCDTDLNEICPKELREMDQDGNTVACMSACERFDTDEYCCRKAHGNPNTCPPFKYSLVFKKACPRAYSYAYDDRLSTFTCRSHDARPSSYLIEFCPKPKGVEVDIK